MLVNPLLHEVRSDDLDFVIVEASANRRCDVSIDVGEAVLNFFRGEAGDRDHNARICQRLTGHRVVVRLDRRRSANEITEQHYVVTAAGCTDQGNQQAGRQKPFHIAPCRAPRVVSRVDSIQQGRRRVFVSRSDQ